ncbi:RadC family protein [Pleomorphovibrio marinus]|uniref:RadC family protein n=1 Tax=Pleomorphovibrio marinus TaxID=2164132 RepID=UPI000E0C587C|nr:DNA repair protein RadC [Pleomorphovibrio marinus]
MDTFGSIPIQQLAEEDRPREKLLLKGRSTLSDAELIAILIGSGTRSMSAVDLSKHLLRSVNYDLAKLARLTVKDLCKFKGIGEAKAIAIVSALELGRRRKMAEPQKRTKIRSSSDVYELLRPDMLDESCELFYCLFLDRANYVLKKQLISSGGTSGTVVDAKVIFKFAIDQLASSIVLAHNHPSGNLKPSSQDLRLTNNIKEAGKYLDIPVVDHVIFTDVGYFSFADEGIL